MDLTENLILYKEKESLFKLKTFDITMSKYLSKNSQLIIPPKI